MSQLPGIQAAQFPEITEAFFDRPVLANRVLSALGENPAQTRLFRDIGAFICELKRRLPTAHTLTTDEPATKKRRLENAQEIAGPQASANGAKPSASGSWADVAAQPTWRAPDMSFSIPQRKKLNMELVRDGPRGVNGGIRAVNGVTRTVEFGVAWRDIEQIFCLPVPEKAKRQHNFIVIPRNGDGISAMPPDTVAPEPLVWTFVEATGKEIKEGVDPGPGATAKAIDELLAMYGKKVVFPDENEFASAIPEPHRKDEKAFHVKAFRGSKEGFLYFTSVGILFGFKKPLAYFAFDNITSISYTSVLQRTFNLVISVSSSQTPKDQEIEFSMLDQQDYAGIDAYVKMHALNDASMAAARKAKRLNINGPPQSKAENGAAQGEDDGETELQKAERMLEDEEDEEEEDYEPGSEGDSDGSGSESEEGENEGDEEEFEEEDEDDDEGRDLVAEELGSEAEEVEISGEE